MIYAALSLVILIMVIFTACAILLNKEKHDLEKK